MYVTIANASVHLMSFISNVLKFVESEDGCEYEIPKLL